MKKVLLLFICCLFGILALVSCSRKVTEDEFTKEKTYLGDQFVRLCNHYEGQQTLTSYMYHKDTNVVYLYIEDRHSNTYSRTGGMVVMYNANGEVITKDTFSNYHKHEEEK